MTISHKARVRAIEHMLLFSIKYYFDTDCDMVRIFNLNDCLI